MDRQRSHSAYAKMGKPAIKGLSFGHGADNAWLPLGQKVRLDAKPIGQNSYFTLTVEEILMSINN